MHKNTSRNHTCENGGIAAATQISKYTYGIGDILEKISLSWIIA